jgi:hypothetical protein
MSTSKTRPWQNPEWMTIMALTILGALLRFANYGRLGTDHYDEGMYCVAGAWLYHPDGIGHYDKGSIAYAPAGYPTLIGLAYMLVGPSDMAAILVSLLVGIATIPLVGWIGRKWFGPGYGAACAAFAALSGSHITFSRMAMTDATFLFCWLVGLAVSAWFLEKPGPTRAVGLGLAVGLAQLVKYNGWLIGATVPFVALLGIAFHREERTKARIVSTFGWGIGAALLAGLVYWPWARFVESQVGYRSLLKHQQSYFGEIWEWPQHLADQLRQVVALSGGNAWAAWAVVLALLGASRSMNLNLARLRSRPTQCLLALVASVALVTSSSGWLVGVPLGIFFLIQKKSSYRLLGGSWLVMTVLTPLYHPYARLWMPLEAMGWLFRGFTVASILKWLNDAEPLDFRGELAVESIAVPLKRLAPAVLVCLALSRIVTSIVPPHPVAIEGLLDVRDSYRNATARIVAKVPVGVPAIRWLCRPPFLFYSLSPLANRGTATIREESLEMLLKPGQGWSVVDTAQLRQEPDFEKAMATLREQAEIVAEEPVVVSPATLLDINTRASLGNQTGRVETLYLVRHKGQGATK